MNIQLQVGGICILLLVLYTYKRQSNLGLYTGRLFMAALYTALLCLSLDILSLLLISKYMGVLPLWVLQGVGKAYLVTLVISATVALAYANADIWQVASGAVHANRLFVMAGLVAVLICVLPIHIFLGEENVIYTYGPSCYAAYAGALLFILSTVLDLFTHRDTINPKRRRATILWLSIWTGAAVLQFIRRDLLLVSFANALSVMILFYELENPEIYIDRETELYNNYALTEFVRQRFRMGKNCRGIIISLENIRRRDISPRRLEAAMAEVTQFLRVVPGAMVFKTDDREFALSFESTSDLNQGWFVVQNRFKRGWLEDVADTEPISLHPSFMLVPSSDVVLNAEELLEMLRYFRLNCADNTQDFTLTLDEKTIGEKRGRDDMLREIMGALEGNRVEVYYQPIYSTVEKRFVSAEALMRLRKGDGSILPPARFIPVAEETGLIVRLGNAVFEKTCKFIKDYDLAQYGIDYIEVNLSGVQCEREDLAKTYIDIMDRVGLHPRHINLEITESAIIAKMDVMLRNMQALIDYGVTFSLDDFGSGQSNLNYIVGMPVGIVKFDRDMTQSYFESTKAQFVLRAAVNMAHDMKLKVISEGVESAEQLEILEALGIDYIQGYHFAPPLEAEAFLQFIKDHNDIRSTA